MPPNFVPASFTLLSMPPKRARADPLVLQEHLKQVHGTLAKLQKELRAARRKHKRFEGPSIREVEVAKAIMCQTGGNKSLAELHFTRASAGKSAGVPKTVETLLAWYNDASDEDKQGYTAGSEKPLLAASVRCAERFLGEQRLHAWSERQNLDKGIAPLSTVVLQQKRKLDSTAACLANADAVTHKSCLQWARRWRRRWGIRMGRVGVREHVAPAVARQKVVKNWLGPCLKMDPPVHQKWRGARW